jgi:hypothetical protein
VGLRRKSDALDSRSSRQRVSSKDEGRMNTLVLLLMASSVPAQTPAVIQSQPSMVYQTQYTSSSTADSGDSGWGSRFRNRPGLFARIRGWFGGRSQPSEQYPSSTTVYPSSSTAPVTSEGRLVPTPVTSGPTSWTPSITYGSGPSQAPSSVGISPAQPMPSGGPQR